MKQHCILYIPNIHITQTHSQNNGIQWCGILHYPQECVRLHDNNIRILRIVRLKGGALCSHGDLFCRMGWHILSCKAQNDNIKPQKRVKCVHTPDACARWSMCVLFLSTTRPIGVNIALNGAVAPEDENEDYTKKKKREANHSQDVLCCWLLWFIDSSSVVSSSFETQIIPQLENGTLR